MKRIICLLLVLVMGLSAVSCIDVDRNPTTCPETSTVPSGDDHSTLGPTSPSVTTPGQPDADAPAEPGATETPPEAIVLIPNEEEMAQINAAMGKTVEFDSGIFRYYGSYDGYMILYESIPSEEDRSFLMWGCIFAATDGTPVLYAIRDGKAAKLRSYYADECLTKEHVEAIHAIHKSYYSPSEYAWLEQNSYYYSYRHPKEAELTASQAISIDKGFYGETGAHLIVNDVSVRYYGQYNGYYIVFEESDGLAGTSVKIDAFTFHHQRSFHIWAIKDGYVYTLEKIYKHGILSFHQLEEIYCAHRLYYWETDEEGYYRFAYTNWETADAESLGLTEQYAAALLGTWQSEYYYDKTAGRKEITSSYRVDHGFSANGTGYDSWLSPLSSGYYMTWRIVGATEGAIVLMLDQSDYNCYCLYYITDSESECYQRLVYWDEDDGHYMISKKISDTAESLVPLGSRIWPAIAYDLVGTWTVTDMGYTSFTPEEDLEIRFNADGTGYKIANGKKRAMNWWHGGYLFDGSVMITYQVEGETYDSHIWYVLDPEDEYYRKLTYDISDCDQAVLEKAAEPEGPAAPATPDSNFTFTDTAEDILGVWTVDHYSYENQTAVGDALELHFEADGQGYVVRNGTRYPAAWYRTGEADGWISVDCMWSVEAPDGQVNYVYSLRYITDSESAQYHQMVYQATDYYTGVLTKVRCAAGGTGAMSAEAALDAALRHLGITEGQTGEWTCDYEPNENRYLITVNYGDTHYVFQVSSVDAGILNVYAYPVTGATFVTARDIALDYLGVDLNDVTHLFIYQEGDGEKQNINVSIRYQGVDRTVTVDFYGRVLSWRVSGASTESDENREDVIGWRAVRDVYLDRMGMTLEDMTYFGYGLLYSDSKPLRYIIHQENADSMIFSAHNGAYSSNNAFPATAILTLTEITEIALKDLGESIRALYESGDGEITHMVHYTGGARENKPQFEYEWTMVIGEATYSYRIDAFTGEILSR